VSRHVSFGGAYTFGGGKGSSGGSGRSLAILSEWMPEDSE
jgi:hypothetical protein